MDRFNKISDEELAAYLDGVLSEQYAARVNSRMDVDTLEVLNASLRGMEKFTVYEGEESVTLPSWEDMAPLSISPESEQLAMAGFLGENHADEEQGPDPDDNNAR